MTTTETSALRQQVDWLVDAFVERVPGVGNAVVVSSDGLLLAMSRGLDRAAGDQLAAVTSGLASLTAGASRVFDGGPVAQTVVEMHAGYLFVTTISDGSQLAVLASVDADIGQVGYEMAQLVQRVGTSLTPELRARLHAALPR
jgi:predicted regulator of Ras-like GTPase activity (Roadblock/LC7/MglB family)